MKKWLWLGLAWFAWNITLAAFGTNIWTARYWAILVVTQAVAIAFYNVMEGDRS